MTRVFLAGATGLVGRRIVALLTRAGHDVYALARSAAAVTAIEQLGATALLGDARDAASVSRLVQTARPDVVMNQLTDLGHNDYAANSELRIAASRHLADAAEAAGVDRVISQSIAWMYEPGELPAPESTALDVHSAPPRRSSVQAVATLEAETARAPHWVVLRYGLFYGPGTWYWTDGSVATSARTGDLGADGDVVSFVHVDDAAAAAVAALRWPNGPVNICDDEPAPGSAWVPPFCSAVGAPPPPTTDRPRSPGARGANNDYARLTLGWTPQWPSWRSGFAAMAG